MDPEKKRVEVRDKASPLGWGGSTPKVAGVNVCGGGPRLGKSLRGGGGGRQTPEDVMPGSGTDQAHPHRTNLP